MDRFPSEFPKKQKEYDRQIIITKLGSTLVWEDLFLEVEFKLVPNKNAFSKIKANLLFDQRVTKSFFFDILQSFGSTKEFSLKTTLDLKGLPSGVHSIKVEIYELWSFPEKHNRTEKEITIEYTPQTKKASLRKVPIVTKVQGDDLAVVSDSERRIYEEIQETVKKEVDSKRKKW